MRTVKVLAVIAVLVLIVVGLLSVFSTDAQARPFPPECHEYPLAIGASNEEHTEYVGPVMEFCGVVLHVTFDKGNTYQDIKLKVGQELHSRFFGVTWTKTRWMHLVQDCKGIFCPVMSADMYLRKNLK